MAATKEHVATGRRPSRRAGLDADELPVAGEVDGILAELEELIHSAELALAAGKHRRQGEHVCTAMCMRIRSLEGMLVAAPGVAAAADNPRRGEGFGSRGRPRGGAAPQGNETGSEEESGGGREQGGGPGDAEGRRHWSEVFDEKQRELVGSLVARLPAIVKRFAQAQRALLCDVADNLMQALDLPLVMQEHKPKKSEKGTPPWVKPKLQTPEGLQELVTLARDTKFCSYEEVVKQIQQANQRSRKKLGADDGSGSEDCAQGVEPRAETWSILLTCPVTLTRMQVPARSLACKHLECFDLLSHLRSNAGTHLKQWHCPICKKSATWNELIVDKYVEKLLADAPPDASELVIRPDASWAVKSAAETLEKLGFLREFVNLADSADDSDSDGEVHSAKATLSPFQDQAKPPSPISKLREEESNPVPERIRVELELADEEAQDEGETEVSANPPGQGVTSAGGSGSASRPATPEEGSPLGSGLRHAARRYAARLLRNFVSPPEKQPGVAATGGPVRNGEPGPDLAPDPKTNPLVPERGGEAASTSRRFSLATPRVIEAERGGFRQPGKTKSGTEPKQPDAVHGSDRGRTGGRPSLPVGRRELAGLDAQAPVPESRLRGSNPETRRNLPGNKDPGTPEKAVGQSVGKAQAQTKAKTFGWGGARVKGSGSRAEKAGDGAKRDQVGGLQTQRKTSEWGVRRIKGIGKRSKHASSVNTGGLGEGGDAGALGGGVQRGRGAGREGQGIELSKMARHLQKARQRKETPGEGGETGLRRKRKASRDGKPARKKRKHVSVNELAGAGPRKRGRPPSGDSEAPRKKNREEGGSAGFGAGIGSGAAKATGKVFPRKRDGTFAKVADAGAKIVSKGRGWVSLTTARAGPVKNGPRNVLESGTRSHSESDSDVPIARLSKGTTPGKVKGTAKPAGLDEGLGEGFGKRVRKQSVRLGEPVSAVQSSRSGGVSGFGPDLGSVSDSGFLAASGFGPGGLPNDSSPIKSKVNVEKPKDGGTTPDSARGESARGETSGRAAQSGSTKLGRESGEKVRRSSESGVKAPSEAGKSTRAVDKSTLAFLEALSRTEQKHEEYLRKKSSERGGANTAGKTAPEKGRGESRSPLDRGGASTAGRYPPEQETGESRMPATGFEVPLPEASNGETQQEGGVSATDWEAVFRSRSTPPEVSGTAQANTRREPESSALSEKVNSDKGAEDNGADSVGRKGEAQTAGLAEKQKEGSAEKGAAASGRATLGAANVAVSLQNTASYSCDTIACHHPHDGGIKSVANKGTVWFEKDSMQVQLSFRKELGLPPRIWPLEDVGLVMGFRATASEWPCQECIVIAVLLQKALSPDSTTQGGRQRGADPAFILFEINADEWGRKQAPPKWTERITFVDVESDIAGSTGSRARDVIARERRDALWDRAIAECTTLVELPKEAPLGPASPEPVHTTPVSAPRESAPVTPVAREVQEPPAVERTSKEKESPPNPLPPSPSVLPDTFRTAELRETRGGNGSETAEGAGGRRDPPGAGPRLVVSGESLKEGGAKGAVEKDVRKGDKPSESDPRTADGGPAGEGARKEEAGKGAIEKDVRKEDTRSERDPRTAEDGPASGGAREGEAGKRPVTKDVRKEEKPFERDTRTAEGGPAGGGVRGDEAGKRAVTNDVRKEHERSERDPRTAEGGPAGGGVRKEESRKVAVEKDVRKVKGSTVRTQRTAEGGPESEENREDKREKGGIAEDGGGNAFAERWRAGLQKKDASKGKEVPPAQTRETAPPRFNSNRLRVGTLTVRQGTVRFTRDGLKVSLVHRKPEYWSEQLEWPLEELGLGYASLFPAASGGNDYAVIRLALKRGIPWQVANRLGTTVQDAGAPVVVFELRLSDWRKVESFPAWRGSCGSCSYVYAYYLKERRDCNEDVRDWLWRRDAEWFDKDTANRWQLGSRPVARMTRPATPADAPADAITGKGGNRDTQPGGAGGAQRGEPSARGKAARAVGEGSPPLTRGQRAASLGDLNIDPHTEVIDLTLEASDGEGETIWRKERKRRRAG
ncbi:E3 SUMO-protein ligase PIAS1 [Klebsormidium nitens]|uniref:E3 SUMO-protein ligase PIAS1 n=1 Tax=Klebsormidium nitens TaxID=105231 RepID=A0A1Y1I469_KLENI|nr:E3 SUMO-protein ligase PIAS1 [Klebsormidium nitens]|eukprot:GAQ83971.1 E3 SUMO-protein ligase PIAS1 [Klebsormidium nitens]